MQRGGVGCGGSASLARRHADLSCVRLSRTLRRHAHGVAMRSRPARGQFRCFRLVRTARNARGPVPSRSRESTNAAQGHVPRGPRTDEKTGLQVGSSARSPRASFNDVRYHVSPPCFGHVWTRRDHIQARDRSPGWWRNNHTHAGCCRTLPVVILSISTRQARMLGRHACLVADPVLGRRSRARLARRKREGLYVRDLV
jgi:hypothetical protein